MATDTALFKDGDLAKQDRERELTHARGSLERPATVEPGDLIWYDSDWNTVFRVEVQGDRVYVHFWHSVNSNRPEWKDYDPRKKMRVRRKVAP